MKLFIIVCTCTIGAAIVWVGFKNLQQREAFMIPLRVIKPAKNTYVIPGNPHIYMPGTDVMPYESAVRLTGITGRRRGIILSRKSPRAFEDNIIMIDAASLAKESSKFKQSHECGCVFLEKQVQCHFVLLCKDKFMEYHLSNFATSENPQVVLRVLASTELERQLFQVAWASAGGHDLDTARSKSRVAVYLDDNTSPRQVDIVVAWGCIESDRMKKALNTAEQRCDGKGVVRCLPYHPHDNPLATGVEMRWAESIAHERAPAVRYANVEVSTIMPNLGSTSESLLLGLLSAPTLLMTPFGSGPGAMISQQLLSGLKGREIITWVVYYSMIKLVKESPTATAAIRQQSSNRLRYAQDVPILEQFSEGNDYAELVPTDNVNLELEYRYGGMQRVAYLMSKTVGGVTIRPGDRIWLTRQDRSSEENGLYMTISPLELHSPPALMSAGKVTSKLLPEKPDGTSSWSFTFEVIKKNLIGLQPGDRVLWIDGLVDGQSAHAIIEKIEGSTVTIHVAHNVIKNASMGKKLSTYVHDWFHPLSRCMRREYGNNSRPKPRVKVEKEKVKDDVNTRSVQLRGTDNEDAIVSEKTQEDDPFWWPFTRKMCEDSAKYNPGSSVWDRPCDHDTDCPFYQRQSGNLYRGGCLKSGYCEMPVGVPNLGYRHVDPTGRPMCKCKGTLVNNASQQCCTGTDDEWVFELST